MIKEERPLNVRIAELTKIGNDNEWYDVATEYGLNPFDEDDLLAYVSAFFEAMGYDNVQKGSQIYEIFDDAIAVARFIVHDAAVQWVSEKYGSEIANELELLLDDDSEMMALRNRRDR
jgi:hypothetical protein